MDEEMSFGRLEDWKVGLQSAWRVERSAGRADLRE